MSVRVALATLLCGVVALLGSCAPLGISAYRSFFSEAASVTPLEIGVRGGSGTVNVTPGKLARVAIKADVNTASVQEVETSGSKEYKPRYRFPVAYTVTGSGGGVVRSGSEVLAWNEGSRSITNEKADSTGAKITVEHGFDRFTVPAPGAISVEARIGEDGTYGARIEKLDLLVYGGLENETPWIVSGIAMLIVGFPLTVVGLVLVASAMAASSAAATAAAPSAGAVPSAPPGPSPQARNRAVICHVCGFLGYLVPLASAIAPLVLWLAWRDSDEFVDDQGREALNFQLSVLIYAVVSAVLILLLIGILLLVAVAVFQFAFMVAAAAAASGGRRYRYPLTLRLVR